MRGAGDWLVCERTRTALAELDAVLHQQVQAEDLQLRAMALHLIERGGKRLRPALLLLATSFGQASPASALRAAAAMELLHVASLYHDDVMDRAPLRRRVASANATWGNQMAALAGTYLFARASAVLASLGDGPNRLFTGSAVELCAGQLQEVEHAYDLELDESDHLAILDRKTATLFELPCRLGGALGVARSDEVEALATYGRHLGRAFQLADDAMDLVGHEEDAGKATGVDLREGVYGLPVLRALRRQGVVGDHLRALLAQARLSPSDVHAALRLVRGSGAVVEALGVARDHAERAREALSALPDGPARRSLDGLAGYAITRVS